MRHLYLVLACLLVSLPGLARPVPAQTRPVAPAQETGAVLGKAAVAALQNGKTQVAMDDLTTILKYDPNSAAAYYLRGRCRLILSEGAHPDSGGLYQDIDPKFLPAAITDFSRAITLDPTNADAYFWRGMSYKALNDFGHAIPDLDQSALLDPHYAEAANDMRGTSLMENVLRGVAALVVVICVGVVFDFCRRHKAIFKM